MCHTHTLTHGQAGGTAAHRQQDIQTDNTHTRAYKNKLHLYEDWRWSTTPTPTPPPAHHIFSLSKQRQSRSLLAVGVAVIVG